MLLDRLTSFFRSNNYTWKYQNQPARVPNQTEIETTLNKMREALTTVEVEGSLATQIELGKLFMLRRPTGEFDVFVYMGEYT